MSQGITRAGQYQADIVEIESHNGEVLDLRAVYAGCEIYEDIYGNCITAKLIISTTQDLIDALPIIGQEKVRLSFNHTGSTREPINLEMHVYKISDFSLKDLNNVFTLELITFEQFANYENRISRYYENSASGIVQELFNELGSPKQLDIQGSEDQQKIIVPGMSPFKAINWLASKAYTGPAADFLFWENVNGYQFKSVSSLMTASPEIEYLYGVSNQTLDANTEDKVLINFKFQSHFNVLDGILGGLYKTKALKVDIINRQTEEIEYNIYDSYMETNKVDSNPLFDISGQGRQYNTANFFVLPENSEMTYNHEETFLRRKSQLKLLNQMRLTATVFGDTQVNAGKTIDVQFPQFNFTDEVQENPKISGKWLITAVKHRFEPSNGYYSDIECIRDSQGDPYPQPKPVKSDGGYPQNDIDASGAF